MLNSIRALFMTPPSADELVFRERVRRYMARRQLAHPDQRWRDPAWLGAVVADVFLQAGAGQHLRCKPDIRTIVQRAAFACHGVARRAAVEVSFEMLSTAAFAIGEPSARKPLLQIIREALQLVQQSRIEGSLEEQPEEIIVPRYISREEPLVLQTLATRLERQVKMNRDRLRPARMREVV